LSARAGGDDPPNIAQPPSSSPSSISTSAGALSAFPSSLRWGGKQNLCKETHEQQQQYGGEERSVRTLLVTLRMRSALQGWTWTLRGRGAHSTTVAGSGSPEPPLPEEEEGSTNVLLFIALVGILTGSVTNVLFISLYIPPPLSLSL
jgi:hypothetical protein